MRRDCKTRTSIELYLPVSVKPPLPKPPDWIAIAVGLHFLPLAKIFRAASMAYIGAAIVLWSVVCWILFRSHAPGPNAPGANGLGAAAALGTGALLWTACVASLLRARNAARSLAPVASPASEVSRN